MDSRRTEEAGTVENIRTRKRAEMPRMRGRRHMDDYVRREEPGRVDQVRLRRVRKEILRAGRQDRGEWTRKNDSGQPANRGSWDGRKHSNPQKGRDAPDARPTTHGRLCTARRTRTGRSGTPAARAERNSARWATGSWGMDPQERQRRRYADRD